MSRVNPVIALLAIFLVCGSLGALLSWVFGFEWWKGFLVGFLIPVAAYLCLVLFASMMD